MKYVTFYDDKKYAKENRSVNSAARTVTEYMLDVLADMGDVEIISPARTLNKSGYCHGRKSTIRAGVTLYVPPSFGVKSRLGVALMRAFTQIWLLLVLLKKSKKGEKIIFYHSLSTMLTISILIKVKKIEAILEFREVYSDINRVRPFLKRMELNYSKNAYGFIFPSAALKQALNVANKPYVYAPGTYRVQKVGGNGFGDSKVHVVYAGNLRADKGGAYLAVKSAEYLSEKYVMHILGHGTEREMEILETEINRINRIDQARIIYEGFKTGSDFVDMLSKCDIGLATQSLGDFCNTSFPSKILTYLGCGLKVISPNIDAVVQSKVSHLVCCYSGDNAKSVAACIEHMASKELPDIAAELRCLDKELRRNLKRMIDSMNSEKARISLDKVKEIQLDILNDVHNFCEKNNIYYSLSDGTLIGAIRHQGYIPWDDDIDISMPRPDYENFLRIYNNNSKKYRVVAYELDNKFPYSFAKVENTETLLVENASTNYNIGVNIDIFPIDAVFQDEKTLKKQIYLRKLLNVKVLRIDKDRSVLKNCILCACKLVLLSVRLKRIVGWMCENAQRIPYQKSDLIANVACGSKNYHPLSKKILEPRQLAKFEDREYYVMSGYDKYLKSQYGDYMELPPIEERTTHHDFTAFELEELA